MLIPLNEFEQHISEKILTRGLAYYQNGNVVDVQELSDNLFEASVKGSDNYVVQIEINDKYISDYSCNCPYDMGPICKHVVATIFYLVEIELNQDSLDLASPKNSKKKTRKKKTVKAQLKEVLENISFDELKAFVEKKALNESQFRKLFLASFSHLNNDESKELHQRQIKGILDAAADRHGFIDWSAVRRVGHDVYNFLNAAREQLQKGNYQSTLFMATATLEEMTKALQFADDSNADIGNNIYFATAILKELGEEKLPEAIRKDYLDYCVNAYQNKIFDGWDWHFDLIKLATKITKTEEEANLVLTSLDAESYEGWNLERAQMLQYELIKKLKGDKEASSYLRKNLKNADLRKVAIQEAIAKKEYDTAISYAQDGIKYDKKNRPGLVSHWYQWLLKVALAQKDNAKIIEYARYLFIDNFRHDENYYAILKEHIPQNDWHPFIEKILLDINQGQSWRAKNLIPEIFIAEKWWDKLMTLIEHETHLEAIEQYEKYLKKSHAEQLIQLYLNGICLFLEKNVNRNSYKKACRYLRRVKKLGGSKEVKEKIAFFRSTYPQRRALMEELDMV